MLPRHQISEPLARLIRAQAGTVTSEQAVGLGLSRHSLARLTRDGDWVSLARGVHLTQPGEPVFEALAWAGLLVAGDGSRMGAESAAYLDGLTSSPPRPVDVLVPHARVVRASGPWAFVREGPNTRSPTTRGCPPRIGIEDTVLDLCDRSSESEVVHWVTVAVQRRLTTPKRLVRRLSERSRVRHRRLLSGLLGDVAAGAESPLEVRFLRDVERAHQLPVGRRQKSRAGLRYCTDVVYDGFGLLAELDGRDAHDGVGRFRDFRRDNEFALRDYLTLRFGWFDVIDHPCEVAWMVASVLVRAGWPGVPARCPRCRNVPDLG